MSLKMAEAESEGLISTSEKNLDLIVAITSTELKESEEGLVSTGKRKSKQDLHLGPIRKGFLKEEVSTRNEGLHSKSMRENVRDSLESRPGTVPIVSSAAEQPYSSLATLATLSVGLASTHSVALESPLGESLSLNSFFLKEGGGREKTLDRSFQMRTPGAQVVVGNVDGFDSVFCEWFASPASFSSEVSSFYVSGRSGILGKSHVSSVEAFLFGTELFTPRNPCRTLVGIFGGRGTKISPSNSLDNDHTAHRTTHSNIVEHPGDYVPGVIKYAYENTWRAVDNYCMFRSLEGSYLEKPKFMKTPDPDVGVESFSLFKPFQLTRYDDYVVMGDFFWRYIRKAEVNDIVRQNAFKSADVVAAQLVKAVKAAIKRRLCGVRNVLGTYNAAEERQWDRHPITVVVILLDHDEIVLRESARGKKGNVASKEDYEKYVAEEVSQSTTLGHDENKGPPKAVEQIMEVEIGEKKVTVSEEDYKMKEVLDESLPIERPELGMKSSSSSNPMEAEVKDVFKAMSCLTVNEDFDYKCKDITESKDISKWIILIDQQEKALLCFFNVEEMQYEFYFEDYESMASIVGVGVDYSKVVIKSTRSYLAVVEILKEDWDAVWEKNSSVMQHLFSRDSIVKHEAFPDILHSIAKFVSNDNIVNTTNDGGDDGGKGKEKSEENVDAHKGNGGVLNNDSIGESSGGSYEDSDTFDNDKLNGENGHAGGEENGVDEEDGNAHDDIKEVSAVVYLLLLPGGIPEVNKKKMIIAKNQEKRRIAKQKTSAILGWFGKAKKKESGKTSAFDECVENAKAQLKDQIHSQMKFTFTKTIETRGMLRTIQATIEPITFQFEECNEDNYMKMRRFGWFHTRLEVAFGVVNPHVAHLEPTSFKVINSLEGKEAYAATTSIGGEKSSANDYQLKVEGNAQVMKIRGEVGRTNKTSSHKTIEVLKSLETNKPLTECDFSIKPRPNLNSGELRYVYDPKFPFNGEDFEKASEEDRLKMYSLPLCSPQSVSFEGTWKPDATLDSKKVEAYKLQAKRDVEMTKPYNGDFQRRKKNDRGTLEKNLERDEAFFFVQSLEKIVFLNHAFSHLDCGIYRLQERHCNPSQTVITQAQEIQEPIWPSSIPLVDVNEHCALVSS